MTTTACRNCAWCHTWCFWMRNFEIWTKRLGCTPTKFSRSDSHSQSRKIGKPCHGEARVWNPIFTTSTPYEYTKYHLYVRDMRIARATDRTASVKPGASESVVRIIARITGKMSCLFIKDKTLSHSGTTIKERSTRGSEVECTTI